MFSTRQKQQILLSEEQVTKRSSETIHKFSDQSPIFWAINWKETGSTCSCIYVCVLRDAGLNPTITALISLGAKYWLRNYFLKEHMQ